ncbi:MAG: 3-methyl-2-oxobutanoate hydroxymethyltransferase [Nitrosomonas sp.]|uniref:3-methyl-2-oxobutanoate hydroxymethyltransferase n=1 Tax=Nitrosomonas sp. TaxID=42353 RepID=UPI002735564E|nr:3-methyl-2-oxobutanoate hydroxymethyltransferase [Nitrosomonas sp.]MDP3281583.1 3-methyl-2-oxobutanoate hydroxymethyltransferase [Nitrosomonas sp.]MDP3663027.1 3-methyl-2-oxobutanoate hydroxymethyltransferase [Nitrosomonas sp.]MDZ4107004.1 3-methyl-2-oxobutanoate hydroxymethyltransferase [Nitrosomonas sp.]
MRITQTTLQKMVENNEKFTVLTCYDATFSTILENAGIDVLLVGDSLGNVLHGENTTLSVTLDDMIYHTRCVARGASKAFIITDMPFGSYQVSPEQAFDNASKILAAGAHMVKIEGGQIMADTIQFLTQRGIPVCAHIGLTPQSIHQLGGYKLQGNSEKSAKQLLDDAKILEKSGASLLVMEVVPAKLAKKITQALSIPTIGIGAGADCSGQVLVLHDMLGLVQGKKPRFVKDFMADAKSIQEAIANYVTAVKTGQFPGKEHEF